MNKSFQFESDLPHQKKALEAIQAAFEGATVLKPALSAAFINPQIEVADIQHTIQKIQQDNRIPQSLRNPKYKPILDIEMETGTGKTYTYTQAMFALNQEWGIFKFVVFVPTLAIKAGTKAFFEQSRQHFAQRFGQKHVCLYEVNSQKNNKKQHTPQAILDFVRSADTRQIHVLLINAGMLHSSNMDLPIEQDLFGDMMGNAFEAVAAVKPFCIVDEPHKIKQHNKTWNQLAQFKPQYILRFGATFDGAYENLIHRLTALDAFSQNLVKGVRAFVVDFKEGNDVRIQFKGLSANKDNAVFEVRDSSKTTRKEVAKNEDLGALHPQMQGVQLAQLKANAVVLSNGLMLAKNEVISPYSFSHSLQTDMLEKAVEEHLKLEQQLLTREPKIKPLTLFFIDDIESYRGSTSNEKESLKNRFENILKAKVAALLETETDAFYKAYLQKTLDDMGNTHGGYFSQDNSDKDEKIEAEINEILHDKAALLSLDNPRRFIFSKWTLREGWDNPNVFQICKLRSSGSETSKLQEVGRGLRLPVNEFMNREKSEQFYLNYFVDFSERDFVATLIQEINQQANIGTTLPERLNDELTQKIINAYPETNYVQIVTQLAEQQALDKNGQFTDNGYAQMRNIYPNAFPDAAYNPLNQKITNANTTPKQTARIRKDKYKELKTLWEAINQRVILQYKITDEQEFAALLNDFFKGVFANIGSRHARIQETTLHTTEGNITALTGNSSTLQHTVTATLDYAQFSVQLAQALSVNLFTLHQVLAGMNEKYRAWQNPQGIRDIAQQFKQYLLHHAWHKEQIGYQAVQSAVHPTAFTDKDGNPKDEIDAANIGRFGGGTIAHAQYLFEQLFYDSDLESENILTALEEVLVFTKIPKNTINIPVAGGGTYSPDFAYVLKHKDGTETLNLVVETKDADKAELRSAEKQKIQHAQWLFAHDQGSIRVQFCPQFKGEKVQDIIASALQANHL